MKAFFSMLTVCVLIGVAPSPASAGFVVSVQQDLTTAPTDVGLVAWNVYILGTGGDRMAAFNADFTGNLCHVWTSVDEVWTATPCRRDLDLAGGKYRNDSHLGFLASELLVPSGNADEANDMSLDAGTGRGIGDLWCPADLGVINTYQSANAHLARIVLPEGDEAMLWLQLWNQNGDGFDMGSTTVPEPATLALVALGGAALLRRRRRG